MKLLITGAGGFLGARLARKLLERDLLAGQRIDTMMLTDQVPLPADLAADARVQWRTGPLLSHCAEIRDDSFDGVFHLASAVSGECETDFELGLRSNLDSTRALLDALRGRVEAGGQPARLVFSSSGAVFGPDPAVPLPPVVCDDTLPAPQTSYGTQKLVCEYLIADYTRKGYLDGRAGRLMTVTVRPGKPNGAASSFFSGIIREPLAGLDAICPVRMDVSHPVCSPAVGVEGLIGIYEASRDAFNGRTAMNLPSLNVRVGEMLDALEEVAGSAVRSRVRFQPDMRIARIVDTWPAAASAARAARLGLRADVSFAGIVKQYIDDCMRLPNAAETLQGMA